MIPLQDDSAISRGVLSFGLVSIPVELYSARSMLLFASASSASSSASAADFEPERYADEYRERALTMIEKKVEGQEIKVVPSAPRRSGQVVDIFAALKRKSLETAIQQEATSDQAKRKRKA
jgi:non-homologous end joining protein Ku